MKNRTVTVTFLAAALAASLALSGCPRMRVGQVRLAAPPKGGKITLIADVETWIEVKPEEEKEGVGLSGSGVMAIWLPSGWKAAAARIRPPGDEQTRDMAAVPEFAPEFPPTFPYQPGGWWPFVATDLWIPGGKTSFIVEVDLEGPARARTVVLGAALGAVNDCELTRDVSWDLSEADPPTEISIDLRQGTIAVRDNPAPVDTQLLGCVKKPEPDAGLEEDAGTEPDACVRQCEELPVYDCDCPECPPPVERGPRGCSCDNPGAPRPAPGLLGLLFGLSS